MSDISGASSGETYQVGNDSRVCFEFFSFADKKINIFQYGFGLFSSKKLE